MRHGKKLAKLNRSVSHRIAMLKNMTTSLIKHERIETTMAKAKAVRRNAEMMVSLGKRNTSRSRKRAESFVREKSAVDKLFTTLADRYKYREGGYTRVLPTRRRKGDNSALAFIEFVDRPGELRPAKPVNAQTQARVLELRRQHEAQQPHI